MMTDCSLSFEISVLLLIPSNFIRVLTSVSVTGRLFAQSRSQSFVILTNEKDSRGGKQADRNRIVVDKLPSRLPYFVDTLLQFLGEKI
jgi:hypothetical protein